MAKEHSGIRGLGIAQVNLYARELNDLRAFYTEALDVDAEEIRARDDQDARTYRFTLPGADLLLTETKRPDGAWSVYRAQEVVFDVATNEDVDSAYERISALSSCETVRFPHYAFDNHYEAVVRDPEGNTLIFRA